MTDSIQQIREALRRDGPESASALGRRLGLSTPTVTRALAKLGDAVATIGKGRSSRHALRREVRDLGNAWPLYRIDREGEPELLGTIEALHGRYRWRLVPEKPLPLFMRGEFAEGLFEDLPWFLQALRPQGYLGRFTGRVFASKLGAAEDISLWQADDVLAALVSLALVTPGNLYLGQTSAKDIAGFNLVFQSLASTKSNRSTSYTKSASDSDVHNRFASSAAGEQPKFITLVRDISGAFEHVIVKFAPLVESNPTAQRWADLLICEEIALRLLAAHGIAAAPSEILDADEWRFLQSTRFDRTPQGGRIGVFALDALDMAFVGSDQRNWLSGAQPLHEQGLIDADDLERIRFLDAFGRLIGNNDMHHGNLSFFAEPDDAHLRLAPIYDMLPMHYRPATSGLVRETPFALPKTDPMHSAMWASARSLAIAFWRISAKDDRISEAFRAVCATNAARIEAWTIAE